MHARIDGQLIRREKPEAVLLGEGFDRRFGEDAVPVEKHQPTVKLLRRVEAGIGDRRVEGLDEGDLLFRDDARLSTTEIYLDVVGPDEIAFAERFWRASQSRTKTGRSHAPMEP